MKKKYFLIIIALCFSALSVPAQPPKVTLNFRGADPNQILLIYSRMSGLALIEDSRVRQIHRPIQIQAPGAGISKTQALKLIEDGLIKQAGIVITHLNDKTVSVTYNDGLPVAGTRH